MPELHATAAEAMTDNGARALAERIRKTGNFYGADEEAAAILANGAVFLPGPVEGAGKTRFWMDEDGTHWRSPAGAPLRDTEGPAHAVTEPAGVSRGTPMSGGAHEMAGERDMLAEALKAAYTLGWRDHEAGVTPRQPDVDRAFATLAARGWRLTRSEPEPEGSAGTRLTGCHCSDDLLSRSGHDWRCQYATEGSARDGG